MPGAPKAKHPMVPGAMGGSLMEGWGAGQGDGRMEAGRESRQSGGMGSGWAGGRLLRQNFSRLEISWK